MLPHLLIHRDSSRSTVILRQTLLLLRLLCNTNNSSVVFQHTIITTISILHLIIMQHYPQAQFISSSMACTIIIVLLLLLSPITIVLLLKKTEETVYHHFAILNPMQHQGSHRPVASLITISIHLVSTLIRPRQFVITTKEIVNCTTKRSYLLQTHLQTALARVRTLVHLHRYHQFLLRETRPKLLLLDSFTQRSSRVSSTTIYQQSPYLSEAPALGVGSGSSESSTASTTTTSTSVTMTNNTRPVPARSAFMCFSQAKGEAIKARKGKGSKGGFVEAVAS